MGNLAARAGFLLIGLLASFVAGCGGGPPGVTATAGALTEQDLFLLGETARAAGNLDAAQGAFERVLSEFPNGRLALDARLRLGDVLSMKGQFEAARSQLAIAAAAGGEKGAEARVAIGNSWAAEFESIDGGTLGFADDQAAGELLLLLEAQEAFRAVAQDASAPSALRQRARFGLADALFRAREFPAARTEFQAFASAEAGAAARQRALVQIGLAFLQEANAPQARAAFLAAGAVPDLPARGRGTSAQLGGFGTPGFSLPGLADLVIVVRVFVQQSGESEPIAAAADLGLALVNIYIENDLEGAIARLDRLSDRRLAAPIGDLARFQLAEALRRAGETGGAVQAYQALESEFPGSRFSERADQRIAEVLFESFAQEATARPRVDGKILANLIASARRAVGDSPRPDLEARRRGLDILGRLDGEGIPVPLTIALLKGLPGAVAGVGYVHGLTAYGARGAVKWSLQSGAMPAGLTLSEEGELRGTPATEGRYVLGLRAQDASGQVDARPALLEVQAIELATPPPLADATVGVEYTAAIAAVGRPPLRFEAVRVQALDANSRPVDLAGFVPGLTLSADGTIRGTPTRSSGTGPFRIALRVVDGAGRSRVGFYSLFVSAAQQAITANPAVEVLSDEEGAELPLLSWSEMPRFAGLPEPQARAVGSGAVGPSSKIGQASGEPALGGPDIPAAAGLPALTLTTMQRVANELDATPDGRTVVVAGGFQGDYLAAVDTQTGQVRKLVLPGSIFTTFPFSVKVSPDGKHAAVAFFSQSRTRIVVVDLATMSIVHDVRGEGIRSRNVQFSPDGRHVVARPVGRLLSLDMQTGTTRTIVTPGVADSFVLLPLPDSRRFFTASATAGRASIVDIVSGVSRGLELPAQAAFGAVVRGGRKVLLTETESFAVTGGRRLFVVDLETGAVDTHFAGLGALNVAVSQNGATAAIPCRVSGELAFFDVNTERVRRVRSPFEGSTLSNAVALTPDGRQALVFDGARPQAALIDVETLESRLLPGFSGTTAQQKRRALLLPDGKTAYALGMAGASHFLSRLDLASADVGLGLKRRPLAAATAGQLYEHRFEAQGGTPGYRFGPEALLEPIGAVRLMPDGVLRGTPASPDLFAVEGQIRDSDDATATFTVPLLVVEPNAPAEPLVLVTRLLPEARAEVDYSSVLAAAGGRPPYAFQVEQDLLPEGLTLEPDGRLHGVPSRIQAAAFDVTVTDEAGATAAHRIELVVSRESPFLAPRAVELPAPSLDLVALDADRDGRTDVAVGHSSGTTNLSVLLGTQAGSLTPGGITALRDVSEPGGPAAASVYQLRLANLNGDGFPDVLAVASPGFGSRDPAIARPALVPLLGNGRGGFSLALLPDVPTALPHLAVGDIDGDRLDDFVATQALFLPEAGILPSVFAGLNIGTGQFSVRAPVVTTSPIVSISASCLADFDGDGLADLAGRVVSLTPDRIAIGQAVHVYPGNGRGDFALARPSVLPLQLTTNDSVTPVAGDLDADGRPDLVVLQQTGSLQGVLHLAYARAGSAGGFGVTTIPVPGLNAVAPVVQDVTGDELADILVPVQGEPQARVRGNLTLLVNLSGGRFDAPLELEAGPSPMGVAAGDFNGDGLPDAVVLDATEPRARLLLGRSR